MHALYTHRRLRYDENTKEYYNASGVEVRVPGFGGTDTIEYLDKSYTASYFNTFVKYFERMGYKKGLDLNGAPYDWRFAPGMVKFSYYYTFHAFILMFDMHMIIMLMIKSILSLYI